MYKFVVGIEKENVFDSLHNKVLLPSLCPVMLLMAHSASLEFENFTKLG
jgi:hypothetical protein